MTIVSCVCVFISTPDNDENLHLINSYINT